MSPTVMPTKPTTIARRLRGASTDTGDRTDPVCGGSKGLSVNRPLHGGLFIFVRFRRISSWALLGFKRGFDDDHEQYKEPASV